MGQIDVQEMINIMQSIEHYKKLAWNITQLGSDRERILPWYEGCLEKYAKDRKYIDRQFTEYWNNINLHVSSQTWGSTSCGWGGIGGAAMSDSYNTIIENSHMDIVCVYWGGKLAYICRMDEKYDKMARYHVPGLQDAEKALTLIYKTKK